MKTSPMVASMLMGAQATLTPEQLGLITQGFIGSALHYEQLDGYKTCVVDDNVIVASALEKAMEGLEQESLNGVALAVTQLQVAFKEITAEVAACEADTKDKA